jgi:hypothetical protein
MRRHQLPPVGRVCRRSALKPSPPGAAVREQAAAHRVFPELNIEGVNDTHQPLVQFVHRRIHQATWRAVCHLQVVQYHAGLPDLEAFAVNLVKSFQRQEHG